MLNLLKPLIIYCSMLMGGALMYACCSDSEYRIIAGEGLVSIFDNTTSRSFLEDTAKVTGAFSITITFSSEVTDASRPGLISSSYAAIDCFDSFKNSIESDDIAISTNQSFNYDSLEIAPGTNLLSLDEVSYDLNWQTISFEFQRDFITKASLEDTVYQFTINATTTDGIFLEDMAVIQFDLN